MKGIVRSLLLTLIFVIGIFCIIASSDGGGNGGCSDSERPVVVSTNPSHGATNVSTHLRWVSITFNEEMVNDKSVTWVGNWGPSLDPSFYWSEDGKTFYISPGNDNIPANSTLTLILNPSTHYPGFQDLCDNELQEYSFTFITGTDNIATTADFIGTWTGDASFDTGPGTEQITIIFTENAGFLVGEHDRGLDAGQPRMDTLTGMVINGVYSFNTTTNSVHTDCVNFGHSGTATLDPTKTIMTLESTGDFCNPEEWTLSAILNKQ